MLYLDEEDVSSVLTLHDVRSCVEQSFRLLSDRAAVNTVRHRSSMENVHVNVMWAIANGQGVVAIKAYPVVKGPCSLGPVPTLLLHSTMNGELLAIMSAATLGRLRTAAASAVATAQLANPTAEVLTVFGTGYQAEAQVVAVAAVMPELREVQVVGRDAARRDAFVARLRGELAANIAPIDGPMAAARAADVIITATRAADPVLSGAWITPGTHINAIGSNIASNREVDRALLERSSTIAVDDPQVAAIECGDLIANDWPTDNATAFGDILTGRALGRQKPTDVTLFESQGVALQDTLCAQLVHRRAVERGAGRIVSCAAGPQPDQHRAEAEGAP